MGEKSADGEKGAGGISGGGLPRAVSRGQAVEHFRG